MPAPAKYPTPPAQLLLLAIRARAVPDPFVEFWLSAIRPGTSPPITIKTPPASRPEGAVVWPRDSYDRSVWQEAMYSAEEGWRRAYERLPPTRAERASSGPRAGASRYGGEGWGTARDGRYRPSRRGTLGSVSLVVWILVIVVLVLAAVYFAQRIH